MSGPDRSTCLLCSYLIPSKETSIVEQHMNDQHKVDTNMAIMVAVIEMGEWKLRLIIQMLKDLENGENMNKNMRNAMPKDDQGRNYRLCNQDLSNELSKEEDTCNTVLDNFVVTREHLFNVGKELLNDPNSSQTGVDKQNKRDM